MVTTTPANVSGRARVRQRTRLQRLYWTLGNLLLFGGVYLLVYVGGMYAYVDFQRAAARGDSAIEAPRVIISAPSLPVATAAASNVIAPAPTAAAPTAVAPAAAAPAAAAPAVVVNPAPAAIPAPALDGQIVSPPPAPEQAKHISTVERLILPSIKVDSKVIEVGWELIEQNGQQASVWQVAEFAVGQHKGSANPGEGDNIVLAGHVGGFGRVFRDLFYVLPGDPVIVYSNGREYRYTVSERLIVDEEGPDVTAEQRAANAELIAPTDHEVLTMVTCWPSTGPDKFTQRVIIRALPVASPAPEPTEEVAPQP
jgi:sortase A